VASTKADNNRVAWTYIDTDSVNYTISAKAVYVLDGTDGSKYGGSVGSNVDRRIPKDLKPRRVKVTASGKPDKWVICYDTTCDLWTTPGTSITLDANGVDTLYTATKARRAEKYRDTCRQTV
jgi:hypothetical protein